MASSTTLQRLLDAINAKDSIGVTHCLAETVHHEEPALGWDLHGRDEVLAKLESGFVSVDCTMETEEVIVTGNREIISYRATAKVLQALPEAWPPETVGREFSVRGVVIARVTEGGLISHLIFHYDLAGIFAQLGVLNLNN
jgi:hypothetical protein